MDKSNFSKFVLLHQISLSPHTWFIWYLRGTEKLKKFSEKHLNCTSALQHDRKQMVRQLFQHDFCQVLPQKNTWSDCGNRYSSYSVTYAWRNTWSEKAKYCREFCSENEQHTSLTQASSFNTAVSLYFTQVHYQNRIIPCSYQRAIFIGTPASNLPEEHKSTIHFSVPHLWGYFRDRSSNQQHLQQSRDKLK